MFNPAAHILCRHQRPSLGQSGREFSLGPRLEGAGGGLELRNTPLKGSEGWGVRGEI
jgi:hypothetical protein